MRLFRRFQNLDPQVLIDSFIHRIGSFLTSNQSVTAELNSALRELAVGNVKIHADLNDGGRVFDENNAVIGKIMNLVFTDSNGNYAFGDDSVIPNVLLLVPNENGYFRAFGREVFSPFVVFDKFNRDQMEETDEASDESEELKVNVAESSEDSEWKPGLDLDNAIVLQGYYLAWLSTLLSVWFEKFSHKNTKLSQSSYRFNRLALHLGVSYFRYYSFEVEGDETNKSVRYVWQKIPIFFLPDRNNKIEYLSNPRKVVYPNEKVPEHIRYPHISHLGIVDLLETPETEKIGLTLTLVDSDDLDYDFQNLRIVNTQITPESKNKPSEILKEQAFTFLSLATKQIPFIPHSDGARMLMGSKNLKQAIQVVDAEEPFLKTGAEKEKLGVNALVAYGLFYGFNFEDGIVVSESFAKKMAVKRLEQEKFTVAVENDKAPKVEKGEWVYRGQKQKGQKQAPFVRIKFLVREGDEVFFGKELFKVTYIPGNVKKIYTYQGRYKAKVINIPEQPLVPYESSFVDGTFIDIPITFEVDKPLEVGDKLMGRHGNKGVVSLILPDEEMPKAVIAGEEKTIDVILSPLGVVSRMNLGQLYETHITVAQKFANFKEIPDLVSPLENVFDKSSKLLEALKSIGADDFGRFKVVYKNHEWRLTVGYQYIVRLDHCVRDKLHVVSFASESELTGQPKKGKSRNGGQRFGELEFWSLYSYGNKRLIKLFASKNLSEKHLAEAKHLNIFPEELLNVLFQKTCGLRFDTTSCMRTKFEYAPLEHASEGKVSELDEVLEAYLSTCARAFVRTSNPTMLKFLLAKISIEQSKVQDKFKAFCEEIEKVLSEFSEAPKSVEELQNFALRVLQIMDKHSEVVEKLEPNWKTFLRVDLEGNRLSGEARKYTGIALTKNINEIFELKTEKKIEQHFQKLRKKLLNVLKLRENKGIVVAKSRKFLTRLLLTKDGYIRNLVIARRLHFSGRAVISPLPVDSLESLGVKEFDIDKVALPVDFGITWLRKDLSEVFKEDKLQNALRGDVKSRKEVARYLNKLVEDREILVILNRQPSLHRHSLQGFQPVFWEHYTIGLPINVCEGFNADFDGDTMAVYFPAEQDEEVKSEIRKMMPSRNPFKLGSGELIYSTDQDMVYGYYLETGKDKGAMKKELGNMIRELALAGDYDGIKKYLRETVIGKYLKRATEENLTLSIYEILEKRESMEKIILSKCRGNQKQYVQLYEKIDTGEGIIIHGGFARGVPVEQYFDPTAGIVKRARRTLIDKKLRVAEAGYFTRKLVEFLGSVRVREHLQEYTLHEIDLNKSMYKRTPNGDDDVKLRDVFGKSRFMYRWILTDDGRTIFIDSEDKIPDHFWIYSPKVVPVENNTYAVSAKWCGKDISKLSEYSDGEYLGVSAGHVIGERGTQLSMETFHTGGRGLSMGRVSASVFQRAFNATSYQEFLESIEQDFYNDMNESLLEKLNSASLYFELLYNFAQQLKTEGIKSVNEFFFNLEKRGPLTCMSFERGLDILEDIEIGREYIETHPRVEYAFFRRCI
ncbi:hypothetical protein [Fervidobacterium thailandense]|uniref:DNA-directed RNA polymerase n=1 Tax=Fervidobacterium thailandense TaxID=1008305 RepID=A0A1E3G088_9BACT|nr:hypothetical protein [Fervidobacterium thailandense]ODN29686.1 hypothetical protein A4H02_09430 [Fervidobacterium thailandense]